MRSVIEPSSNSQTAIYTSATDIRASPRLAGYLYMLIASVVMIASVAQFYKNDNLASAFFNDLGYIKEQEFILIAGTRVFRWKFIGAFVIACVGTLFSLLILLVHFDTFCFPRFWRKFFRDGSIYERNLLIVAIIYWAAGVHICTSSFSIGATQANVYFTTWIVFIASALNYDMWRLGADMPNLSEFVSSQRKTTIYNWLWTFLFTVVTAGAVTDMYANREHFIFYDVDGEPIVQKQSNWVRTVAITWSTVAVSGCVIFAKTMWGNWKGALSYFEGLLIATFIGVTAWVCTSYTGVQGVIIGPSNAYFGVWGVFFSSLSTFGTWLIETGAPQQLRHFSSSVRRGSV